MSARIERNGDTVTWSDFANENNFDERSHPIDIGPFTFQWDQYVGALRKMQGLGSYEWPWKVGEPQSEEQIQAYMAEMEQLIKGQM
ncbi:hypothetical protein [Brevibacillus dissolubilis]|uniref:hypothetical protein n=1 Tax=Brevibacillus dissolubilis TaxID=1844116 RepID=UPI0011177F94|nr:hypothetical protein [Brevibacillus dissolubilis]